MCLLCSIHLFQNSKSFFRICDVGSGRFIKNLTTIGFYILTRVIIESSSFLFPPFGKNLFNIHNIDFFSLINLSCHCIARNLLVFVTIFFKSIIVWLHGFFPFSDHIFLKYFLQFKLFSLLSLQNQVLCF
jgi:hypothetical protein